MLLKNTGLEHHNGHTIDQINDTRIRVKQIKEQMKNSKK